MTNSQLEKIYQSAIALSHGAGLRAVYNAGYYAHAGVVPDSGTQDIAGAQTLPTAYVKLRKPDD